MHDVIAWLFCFTSAAAEYEDSKGTDDLIEGFREVINV